jgi:hypothetical protein
LSAQLLIAAGRGPARLPTCEQALWDARAKFYHLVAVDNEDSFFANRSRYDLRPFDEWQDDHDATTCALREVGFRTARVDDFSPVLVRALSLFGPGELRALRVVDVDVLRLVTSLMRTASVNGGGGLAPQVEQKAFDALCAIHANDYSSPSPDVGLLAALLERHSSTITELDVDLPPKMHKAATSALACCTRLESLTRAYSHDPGIWLRLSLLHTLRGVDLSSVSFAAIAAALPKLHTLMAFGECGELAQVAGFFSDLLPRLRVFHFYGSWPVQKEQNAASIIAPLPLLEELVWDSYTYSATITPREFLGAQPTVLQASYAFISTCWLGAVGPSASLLARVCDLQITTGFNADPLDPSDVARI